MAERDLKGWIQVSTVRYRKEVCWGRWHDAQGPAEQGIESPEKVNRLLIR